MLLKGCLPSAITKTTTPNDHVSAFYPKYYLELKSYGAMKFGVPQIAFNFLNLFAEIDKKLLKVLNPKSMSFNCYEFSPFYLIKIFCGLISL